MAEARVERRLAAILAADVVGYSRLMGEDEAGRRGECANVPTWRVLCELLMPPSRTATIPPTCAVRGRDPQRQEYVDTSRPLAPIVDIPSHVTNGSNRSKRPFGHWLGLASFDRLAFDRSTRGSSFSCAILRDA